VRMPPGYTNATAPDGHRVPVLLNQAAFCE
jgi:hypothetical protein